MKIAVVYDDSIRGNDIIVDIIGDIGFGEIVVKRKRLEEYYHDEIKSLYSDIDWFKINTYYELSNIEKEFDKYSDIPVKILHCFSNFIITDWDKYKLSLKKIMYIDNTYKVFCESKVCALMFPNVRSYIQFCKNALLNKNSMTVTNNIKFQFETDGLTDISQITNFIRCITGNFESRYFNSLHGDDYKLIKTSNNIEKIKREYTYYYLLPNDMKIWFVMPFNYQENKDSACYTMERLHMTDLSVKWVHGSISIDEFSELIDKYFYFFKCRHSKVCSKEEFDKVSDNLYCEKVKSRISDLKKHSQFSKIENMLNISSDYNLDNLLDKYFELKKEIEKKNNYKSELVIGHGDPCFSNVLYNKSTKTLKFIDPKGALSEEELWTNAYYDIAKLSHSVCGNYDFFNNGLFDIKLDENLLYKLEIFFDNSEYKRIFKEKLLENGYDYLTVRIYEVSLFLSMLPLHIDNVVKVFGFILNLKNIMEEIEKDV